MKKLIVNMKDRLLVFKSKLWIEIVSVVVGILHDHPPIPLVSIDLRISVLARAIVCSPDDITIFNNLDMKLVIRRGSESYGFATLLVIEKDISLLVDPTRLEILKPGNVSITIDTSIAVVPVVLS